MGSAGQGVRLEIKVSLVQDSPEVLHCVLEQDTLSSRERSGSVVECLS